MKVKNKNVIIASVITFIFTALLSCGIFAVVTKSVSFNLALKLDPQIYFSLSMKIDKNGSGSYSQSYLIFDNKTGANVVNWATVNQNCIVLNQVLAGDILSNLTINSRFEITVTNLTQSNEVEYLNLTLNYNGAEEVFKADNGYGAVNMEYGVASGDTSATKTFTLIPQTTLLDGYIQIPFKAEIDTEKRYTATITTENCKVVSAPRTFTKNSTYVAQFESTTADDVFEYIVTINSEKFNVETTSNTLRIPAYAVTGNITVDVYTDSDPLAEDLVNNVWSGGVATHFAEGRGTAVHPFKIYNSEQLALLAHLVNNAYNQNSYSGTATLNGVTSTVSQTCHNSVTFGTGHYELMNNLYLNDETFTDLENGYVEVTDGTNTAYIGTGYNSVTAGSWFSNTSGTAGAYGGTLNEWKAMLPYGNESRNKISIKGNGKSIAGMYNYNFTGISSGSLLGSFSGSACDLGLESGFSLGQAANAGIASVLFGKVKNCYNKIIVVSVGIDTSGSPQSYTAGICGTLRNSTYDACVENCVNYANIYAAIGTYVGGICGGIGRGAQDMGGYIKDSYNLGNIYYMGTNTDIGGISGGLSCGYIDSSYNFGKSPYGGVIAHSVSNNIFASSALTNNYFLSGTATYGIYGSQSSPAGQAEELATVEDMIKSMKNNWDFSDTWEIKSGNTYPTLKIFNKG